QRAAAVDATYPGLEIPKPGDHALRILSPEWIELFLINTKPSGPAPVDRWDWVDDAGNFVPPDMASLKVVVNGQTNTVTGVGFKRRPLYGPQAAWGLRIANSLFLHLNTRIAEGQTVAVLNDGTLWPTNMPFTAAAEP